jgi:hypothetical protein
MLKYTIKSNKLFNSQITYKIYIKKTIFKKLFHNKYITIHIL